MQGPFEAAGVSPLREVLGRNPTTQERKEAGEIIHRKKPKNPGAKNDRVTSPDTCSVEPIAPGPDAGYEKGAATMEDHSTLVVIGRTERLTH